MSAERPLGDVEIRRAEHGEIAAAVSVWAAANRRPATGGHAERLRLWSEQDGARLYAVVDDEDGVVGTLLSLLGREADGAGDIVPGWRSAKSPPWKFEGASAQALVANVLIHAPRRST